MVDSLSCLRNDDKMYTRGEKRGAVIEAEGCN